MRVSIPEEIAPGETAVAATPETVKRFVAAGMEVTVEAGAGSGAFFDDAAYQHAGAAISADRAAMFRQCDVLLKVRPPCCDPAGTDEINLLRSGTVLICVLEPARNAILVGRLAEAGVTSFALDAIPRIARAQSMDVLSSMSSLAGYRAVLLAASMMSRMIPMMMSAAGTVRPANALIIGAGVAGLQAIATARRLGAAVKAIDVRPAVEEQVQSLGAKFIPLTVEREQVETAGGYAADLGEEFYRSEQEIIAPHLSRADMVVSTAMIPGRAAPLLVTAAMVESMPGGSVIVDLAAATGGNCTLTRPDETVVHKGVTILGPRNLPAQMPAQASVLFARNAAAFLFELIRDGNDKNVEIDMDNQILRETLITRDGRIVHEPTLKAMADRKEHE